MISTYDSVDEDKAKSAATIAGTYWTAWGDLASGTECGVFSDGIDDDAGICTDSPISVKYMGDPAGFTLYEIEITQEGEFQFVVGENYEVVVRNCGGATLISPPDFTHLFGGTHSISLSGTGAFWLYAVGHEKLPYTDDEIGVATSAMIESIMPAYNNVIFAPGTWKIKRAALCTDDYTHVGHNPAITYGTRGFVNAADCDFDHDEVQWIETIAGYTDSMVGNNVTPGYKLEDYVHAGRLVKGLSNSTATAQPFIILDGIEIYGDEVTLKPPQPTSDGKFPDYQYETYRQTLARPGGGQWSLNDVNRMEIGVVLGNITNPTFNEYTSCGFDTINKAQCTQIYADVFFLPPNVTEETTLGFTQYGFKVFENGMDEWALPVFDNGMNLYTHKIYTNVLTEYIAKGQQLFRGVVGKLLKHGPTSHISGRGRTHGSITG
jgi:hypothetical protein